MIITIDGPVASGKSSLARVIANKLSIYYLNTGLLYRGLAYILINKFHYKTAQFNNRDVTDIEHILKKMIYFYNGEFESLKYNGQDVTQYLKTPEIDKAASVLSENKQIRFLLINFQYNIAHNVDLITDGRDCGSVVFPQADIKIFLTASIIVRAKRWQRDQELKGNIYSLQECEQIITERDKRDQERTIAPLIIPKDAIVLDNSDLTQEETIAKALEIINYKIGSSSYR